MKHIRILLLLTFTLTCVVYSADFQGDLTPEIFDAYKTLNGTGSYFYRRQTAIYLKELYISTSNIAILPVAIDLLRSRYNHEDFDEGEDTMFYDDIVAEELVEILRVIQHPESFSVLADIVVSRNHRQETIDAAWDTIQLLEWDGTNLLATNQ